MKLGEFRSHCSWITRNCRQYLVWLVCEHTRYTLRQATVVLWNYPLNCNICISPSQPPNTWTCPCGLGYWDGRKKELITGDRVRSGEAQTRADYYAHLLQCSRCRAQAEQDGLAPLPGDRENKRYFLPGEGIDPEVITKYIKTYLGADASVASGKNPVRTHNRQSQQSETFLILPLE